ncbi:RPS6KL1 isoform 11 [Pan troglodytes]|uniref:non-specific serine/threonine protein kinase n=5 Tax=Pan TaxID=9596 RepID=A0A6D2XAY6_PANTR|nr:ribosomal protein S6 kinase-like 1 isoform X2 [Pan troglodytes]XP_003824221.1 ribosomal protein S6 kinase-like 1 isoform X2 [Pan paniscus]XP_034793733.1 ribosomal protein S6 kinase-like 1 isoform X2 [Pan paniscus]XP_054522697.1 ribosomal protein S6 kinase-like 1 isoform X2 [Pan troglodytes]XP_054522698.1 ribosomal protein S6 kinase-like 1 isoform X2 [Pan troglodytes]XP_054522699.1 ribosomal protein S6 kinase-like 1 isoform X2 [Pan troglodytes]XP_054522700.1 ribosomal protein S6 kinase-like
MSLVACECLPSPGLEPEPCSRARSQARVYLEQIRNRVALGVPDMTKRDYLVDAATQIRLALERDVSEDYEAAFNHYQNGVDVLLRGIHVDPNKERREAVKLKITKYLRRAEEIFNCHLQRPLSSGASPSAGFSSLRLRPIRTLSSAVEQLRGCRVVGVIEKVQLVQDPATGGTFVVKSLPRCHMVSRERLTIIPHGVPYMTKLLRYFVSEDSIFLHLEHVQGGTLWSHLLSQAHSRHSGLSSGSTQERMKAQLNPHLNLLTPARLPSGHVPGQDRIALEPPRTSPNLLLAGEAPSTRPQREAEGEPTARTSTSGSSDLPKAPGGHLHLQARRAGQNSDAGPPRGLTWVPEGASPVLGGCGRGMDQSCLSADGAGRGCGRATWSVREEQVKQWAAEMLVALEALHEQGVLCRDLHPGNLLLDQAGHIRLTYFGQWSEVEPQCCGEAVDNLYSAPEVGGISELTEACDWWSFGSLLYELLTGMALSQSHPSGIQAHTQLQLPEWLSRPAASLLTELLQFEPTRRLGMGEGGVSKLKSHPFFSTIHWSKLVG